MKFLNVQLFGGSLRLAVYMSEDRYRQLLSKILPEIAQAAEEWKQHLAKPEPEYQI